MKRPKKPRKSVARLKEEVVRRAFAFLEAEDDAHYKASRSALLKAGEEWVLARGWSSPRKKPRP